MVEKAALEQMNNHCEQHNIILDYQSAYRANYSCETALVKLVNDVLWCYENKEAMQIVAIDLSAAFDMVDHDLLLSVLQKGQESMEKHLTGVSPTLDLEHAKLT